jgi:tetratricopeptide (TPR) repeat protein
MPDGNRVSDLLRRGIAAAKAGQKREARQALLRVTELDEWNEQAWLWLSGVVELAEDRRVCLENALAINPRNSYAQAGLRWLNQQSPPPTAAEECCPRCQSPVPQSGKTCPRCRQALIVACPECLQYVDVREAMCPECGRSLGDFRDRARYHLALAQRYLDRHRFDLVQEAVHCAEAEATGDPEVLEAVAALHEEVGHTDQAIAAYQRAIECDPKNTVYYTRLGAIYRRRSMPDEALAMYEQAAGLASRKPAILFELAQLYHEEGIASEALKLLEQIVRLDPEHAHAHKLLSDIYLSQRQGTKAVEHYRRAYELTTPDTLIGREVRRRLAKLEPSVSRRAQGWGETLRRTAGLMLSPVLAAFVNARLVPWEISLAAVVALGIGAVGACLWICATDVPRNPLMCELFGEKGVKERWQKAAVGGPGVFLWFAMLGAILWGV